MVAVPVQWTIKPKLETLKVTPALTVKFLQTTDPDRVVFAEIVKSVGAGSYEGT
jgi:hypothetical protein